MMMAGELNISCCIVRVNMSGELKDPSKSILCGTLGAVGFTYFIYVLLSVLGAALCSTFLLQNDYFYMIGICVLAQFVTVGIITATWFASLTNLISCSRVLATQARDNIFGKLYSFHLILMIRLIQMLNCLNLMVTRLIL